MSVQVEFDGGAAGDPWAGDPTVEWSEANAAVDQHDDEDQAVGDDPEAPYGRNPRTGKPYKMTPEAREALGAKLAEGRRAAMQTGRAPAKKRRGSTGPGSGQRAGSRPPAGPDYRMAVAGLLQLPAMALGVGARFNPALGLDAAALALHTAPIADAIHHLALDDPRIAQILDRVMQVGPYGALVAAVSPLLVQVLCNHGVIRPNPTVGALTPEELLTAIGVPPEDQE
jgi:hypothetical protein